MTDTVHCIVTAREAHQYVGNRVRVPLDETAKLDLEQLGIHVDGVEAHLSGAGYIPETRRIRLELAVPFGRLTITVLPETTLLFWVIV